MRIGYANPYWQKICSMNAVYTLCRNAKCRGHLLRLQHVSQARVRRSQFQRNSPPQLQPSPRQRVAFYLDSRGTWTFRLRPRAPASRRLSNTTITRNAGRIRHMGLLGPDISKNGNCHIYTMRKVLGGCPSARVSGTILDGPPAGVGR